MRAQSSPVPGVLLALTSWGNIEAADWMLLYYPAHTQEDRQERAVTWEFHVDDQLWHPQEMQSLEQALREYSHLVSMDAAQVRRLWEPGRPGAYPGGSEQGSC
jgi:hypothetical protein